jgi:phospho-N-acetylmuramoyl-pentapeptide-transferase
MGGVAFLIAACTTWLIVGEPRHGDVLAIIFLTLASGALGLLDDLASLRRKRRRRGGNQDASTGLLARYRLLAQTAIALVFALYAVRAGHAPFGQNLLDALTFTIIIVGSVNALNFSDGLDGLAAGMMAIMLLLFIANPFAVALLGSLLGFLWYNTQPARVFMGGVGAEALGAALAGLAILNDVSWYLPLIALMPVLEVLSVMMQVSYFRLSGGKRIFLMSPLHHHLELSGWSETQVVGRFYLVTAFCVALTWVLWGGSV